MKAELTLLILLLAPWVSMAQQNQLPQMAAHQYPGDHLTISIPAGWVEISNAELKQMSANIRVAAPNAKPQPFNYGFQISAAARYPRVVVQVKTGGRWPEETIAELPKISGMKDDLQRQIGKETPGLAAWNVQVGRMAYDPMAKIVWLRMQATGDEGETVQIFSGIHPTNVGSIQVNCYASAETFDQYAPLFSQIITSVKIDDEWKYGNTNAPSSGGGHSEAPMVAGAAAAISAAVAVRARQRRKRNCGGSRAVTE